MLSYKEYKKIYSQNKHLSFEDFKKIPEIKKYFEDKRKQHNQFEKKFWESLPNKAI